MRLLLSGIAGTLPLGRVSVVGSALMGLVAFGSSAAASAGGGAAATGLGWLTAALQVVPDVAATAVDKQVRVVGWGEGEGMGFGLGRVAPVPCV